MNSASLINFYRAFPVMNLLHNRIYTPEYVGCIISTGKIKIGDGPTGFRDYLYSYQIPIYKPLILFPTDCHILMDESIITVNYEFGEHDRLTFFGTDGNTYSFKKSYKSTPNIWPNYLYIYITHNRNL